MLRIAATPMCDADLVPIMLVHDGILFELDTEEQVQHAKEITRAAGAEVCGGLEIGRRRRSEANRRRALPRHAAGCDAHVADGDGGA